MNKTWTMAQAWNASLLSREDRPIEPRDRMWATELGKAPVDVFLKMKGVEPTNPPDPRALRKFEAGRLHEHFLTMVLLRAGILMEQQTHLSYQYPGLIEVTGKLDFIAGGIPNPDNIKDLENLPDTFTRGAKAIVEYLSEKYPDGLPEIILEVKSCSAYMYEHYERSDSASENHALQLFHYLKATNMDIGHIVYMSKDDLRMLEIEIKRDDEELEDLYKSRIQVITEAYKSDVQPEKEREVVFDMNFMRFMKNFRVEYSDYLSMLYKYETPKEFFDTWKSRVEKYNRVLKRIVDRKDFTEKNKEAWAEVGKYFTQEELDQIISEAKKHKELIGGDTDEG